jgi:REP element-mobilizing transposase RayT
MAFNPEIHHRRSVRLRDFDYTRGGAYFRNVAPGSLGAIVRSFKSAATKHINQSHNTPGTPVWQRNYYERVIRDEGELEGIRRYIAENPARWEEDENHPARRRVEP